MTTPILLVEDEPNDVFFFEHALKKSGITHPLHVARDGQEALDYLAGVDKFSDRAAYPIPQLVVLDLNLPRATGFEVLRQVRQHPELQQLIVLVLTSSASDDDITKAYVLGANAYLVKSAEVGKLVTLVEALGNFWLKHNVPPPIVRAHLPVHDANRRRMIECEGPSAKVFRSGS